MDALAVLPALVAAYLLSKKNANPVAWWLYTFSNICWIIYAFNSGQMALLINNLLFLVTSVLGIKNHYFQPAQTSAATVSN